jgi:predicted transcriptional regulator
MKAVQFALVLGFTLTSVPTFGAEQKVMQYVMCKNQKTVRTIRITPEQAEPNDCQVTYSKSGVDEVVGQSRSITACKSILRNIQDNLESSNFNCKKVESATVSYSSEITIQ